jgi:putative multiple sugar transport system substrate-binding protein
MKSRRAILAGAIAMGLVSASHYAMAALAASKGTVGLLMPTITSQRWVVEGLAMTRYLDGLGYSPNLKFADDDVNTQIAQIEEMLKGDVKVLIIGAIDGAKLAPVLQKAADKKVKVIAYDRLIRNTPNVDYYVTFDNFQVGVLQGSDIIERLGLAKGKGPFHIELFGGSPDDNNAFFFYNGAMSVLKPYLDKGQLVVGSGQVGMDNVSTLRWNGTAARARLVKILDKTYVKDRLDAILSPYDGMSLELINALKKAGYGQSGQPMAVVTGQDAEIPSVRSIIRGEQTSTIFKDTRELAKVASAMVDSVVSGKKPTINDEKTYNNGQKVVPAFLLKPVIVDANNWRAALVTTGYYKEEQVR